MFKIFLKLLGVTRTWIRILGSGSVKKFIKTEKANDSGSYQTKGECLRIWILESGLRTPDSHRVRTIRYGPPPPDLIVLELLMYVRVTRHLDHL